MLQNLPIPDVGGWLTLLLTLLAPSGVVAVLLNRRISRKTTQIAAAKATAETATAEALTARTKVETLAGTFDLYVKEIAELRRLCEGLQRENARQATAQRTLRASLLRTQTRLREVEAQCARLQAHLDAYEAAVRQEPDQGEVILARVATLLAAAPKARRRRKAGEGGAP